MTVRSEPIIGAPAHSPWLLATQGLLPLPCTRVGVPPFKELIYE